MRPLAAILGKESLSETDRKYLEFSKKFKEKFINQSDNINRRITESLDLGRQLLKILPKEELRRVRPKDIEKFIDNK